MTPTVIPKRERPKGMTPRYSVGVNRETYERLAKLALATGQSKSRIVQHLVANAKA